MAFLQRKYGGHKDNHQGLTKRLRDQGENDLATAWSEMETVREQAFYGYQNDQAHIQNARSVFQRIKDAINQ